MPAQHLVPTFADILHASTRVQANALQALALSGEEPNEADWAPRATAALILGAKWAGERLDPIEAAMATRVPVDRVARQLRAMSERLQGMTPRDG